MGRPGSSFPVADPAPATVAGHSFLLINFHDHLIFCFLAALVLFSISIPVKII